MRLERTESFFTASATRWQLVILISWLALSAVLFQFVFRDAPLLDHYSFRQTQTASAAREIMRGGPVLGYHLPVLGPPWSVPMEFPTYQFAVGKAAGAFVWSVERTGRLTSLFFASLSLLALWRLCSLVGLQARTASMVIAFCAFSPVMLYWSQSVMIETAALCFSLLMAMFHLEVIERRGYWALPFAVVASILAALTKSTTFGQMVLALIVYSAVRLIVMVWQERRLSETLRLRILEWFSTGFTVVLPGLVAATSWIAYSDGIKEQNPLAAFLTSAALSKWNFGSQEDFLLSLTYLVHPFRDSAPPLLAQMFGSLFPIVLIASVAGLLVCKWRKKLAVAALLTCFFLGPAIFRNLFETHHYYWVSNYMFFSAAAAIAIDELWKHLQHLPNAGTAGWKPKWLTAVAPAIMTVGLSGSLLLLNDFYLSATRKGYPAIQDAARAISESTSRDQIVVVYGFDWHPAIQFYADRRMIMARSPDLAANVVKAHIAEIGAIVFCRNEIPNAATLFGSIGQSISNWSQPASVGFCHIYTRMAAGETRGEPTRPRSTEP